MTKQDYGEMVYPISHAAFLAQDMAQQLASPLAWKIKTYLPTVDEVLNPMLGGALITVLGRPQNAKSFFSDYMLRVTMDEIIRNKKQAEQIVILVNSEVSVEITALKWMARYSKVPLSKILRGECDPEDLEKVDDSAYKIMGLPMVIIGHSSGRTRDNKRVRPNLTPDSINGALEYIFNEYKVADSDKAVDPRLIVTDYLQLLHVPPAADRRSYFTEAMRWAKDVALWGGCPHILNVQAKREVDGRDVKIPLLGDGGEAAAIEQFSDVVFSVHMPKVYNIEEMRAFDMWNIPELVVTDYLLYIVLLKQKDGFANKGWVFHCDFDNLDLKPFNIRH